MFGDRPIAVKLPMRWQAVAHRRADTARAAGFALGALLAASSACAAAGTPQAGQQVFAARCATCHAAEPGQNKIGPSLSGVVGSKAGAVPRYTFSPAMKNANVTWDDATLDKFLANPSAFIHGTKMFATLPSDSDRANVIAYLDTLKK